MYEGELVTFKIKDKEALVSISLLDIDSEINEEGLLLKNNKNGEVIGYFEEVYGINFYEMMRILGYEFEQ